MGTCQKISANDEVFTFFFTAKSPFSNFFSSPLTITTSAGVQRHFISVKQCYAYQKAMSADDQETANMIMAERNPSEIKKMGQKIKGFDQKKWNVERFKVMRKAVFAKYTQNQHLRLLLFLTTGSCLVEASPADRFWGIGLPMNHADASERSRWRGRNALGQLLTDLREHLWKLDEFRGDRATAEKVMQRDGYFATYFFCAPSVRGHR